MRLQRWTLSLIVLLIISYTNPAFARFVSPDPLGLEGGINLFVFVENNPLNAIDPDGLATVYVWRPGTYTNPQGNTFESRYGHAAIRSDYGGYLSHHPEKSDSNYWKSKFRTMQEDITLYGRPADYQYYIDLPYEKSMNLFIERRYKKNTDKWGFYQNCADSVSNALNVGGNSAPDFSDGAFDFISYPEEVIDYLNSLNNPNNFLIKDVPVP